MVTYWMTAAEAAAYIRAPLSRVRKLTMIHAIPYYKEGRRVLYDRAELDIWVRGQGGV